MPFNFTFINMKFNILMIFYWYFIGSMIKFETSISYCVSLKIFSKDISSVFVSFKSQTSSFLFSLKNILDKKIKINKFASYL